MWRARSPEATPFGNGKTLRLIAALRHDPIDAPIVIDGPITGAMFPLYRESQLVPAPADGDIVILNTFGSHKSTAARKAIKAAGARMWFPPP
ncbi:MAG: transposase [Pseudomonadota bacterium]